MRRADYSFRGILPSTVCLEAVLIEIQIFWVVTWCELINVYENSVQVLFSPRTGLMDPENGNSMIV
jgi:hypothetical protein